MKPNPIIRTMTTCSHFPIRVLSAAAALALLAAGAPATVHAGDDAPASAKRHHAAKLSHARHVHYTTEPVIISHESTSEKKAEKPIQHDSNDESLFRSWQENNLLNPG